MAKREPTSCSNVEELFHVLVPEDYHALAEETDMQLSILQIM
jgi:hypothetical protein